MSSYREDKSGQVLEEGINESGAMSSWIAAGTAYTNHDLEMIPIYIFYSMFGFQRVGDLAWAAGDSQARGFFVNKVEFAANEHFANPTDEEEKRVWHDELNLARRDRAIELAKEKGCQPIQIALSYVVNLEISAYPLVGPRNFFELDSCINATNIELSTEDLRYLETGN